LEEWFEHDALLGSLAALGCRGVLQGPMAAGTAYVFLRSLVSDGGPRSASWVCGGMARLGVVLSDVARAAGVEVRTGARVGRILVEDGAVRGVELESGETVDAGVVASSADPVHTLLGLVDPAHLDPEFVRDVGNIRIQGACAKVHLALDGLPGSDTTPAASMCLAPSIRYLERAYDDAKYGRVSTDPHLEVLVPSVLDPSVAPDGRHVASVLFQYAPRELREGSWDDEARASLADAAIGALDRCVPGFAERVTDRHVSTPADLEARFGLTGGHMHHGEMTLDQSFLGRPVPGWTRYEMPVRGLYLCGAGAHPGGGLTGTPGANAARAITRRRR
ncbi:MAG: NAD(P)/FAD-dependent oxidoreductase, partial [Gemmatimonadota bacterium]|nr:NAD(P)/FAD-dependent oxidoreductase [Gemmatimonadota bacterium]